MKYIILFIITILIIHILSKLHLKYVIRDNKRVTQYTYYINLEHRKDRKEETITELNNFGIDNPIRFNAIKDEKNGHIGCSKSHLAILKEARSKNYPYVMTVEDDIEFMNPDETNRKLNNIINSDLKWDVILLSCGHHSDLNKKINKDSVKVDGCSQTTGYIIKKESPLIEELKSIWDKEEIFIVYKNLKYINETKDENLKKTYIKNIEDILSYKEKQVEEYINYSSTTY